MVDDGAKADADGNATTADAIATSSTKFFRTNFTIDILRILRIIVMNCQRQGRKNSRVGYGLVWIPK